MFEAKITKNELMDFLNQLKKEDKLEFENFLKNKTIDDFLDSCFDNENEVYYLKTNDDKPLALGGVYHQKADMGQVWLLVSKYFSKNKKDVMRYVFSKISNFKKRFNILFNYIYKSNFSSLKWLKKLGFKVEDLNNSDYKFFYFYKGA